MTRPLLNIPSCEVETLRLSVSKDAVVVLEGTLTMRDPGERMTPFLRAVHEAAVNERRRELQVDVTKLTHVNSSSLFVFLDWARWIAAEPVDQRYVLHFQTRPGVAWQQLTLPTMQRICAGYVKLSVRTSMEQHDR
ncbi:MAG: hypothetical protein U0165_09070 [Polyangiaceae bacterium]